MIPFERNPERRGHDWGELGRRLAERATVPAPTRGHADRLLPYGPESEENESRAAWLVGPLLLASVASGMLFVFRGPDHVFGIALGIVLGLGFLWVLVSVLFPGKPDRTCPRCGNKALERLDPGSTHGLRCRMCKWEDADASSFLLAEEEGPFEDAVMRDRDRRPRF